MHIGLDIKLYARNEQDIDSLIHTTRLHRMSFGMSIGLGKCVITSPLS